MRILVVTPTYNERENLEPLCAAVLSSPVGADFLVVDDASPDGTGRIADAIAAREPRFRVLHRAGKLGLGTAYVEAFEQALEGGYDAVITMDGDWSHDPKYLPDLVDATSRAELVIGSRYLKGISVVNWDLKRLILSPTTTRGRSPDSPSTTARAASSASRAVHSRARNSDGSGAAATRS